MRITISHIKTDEGLKYLKASAIICVGGLDAAMTGLEKDPLCHG
jgi:hypothetical protein